MTKMLGIVGGIAPESTIAYYRQLIAAFPDQPPSILINSIDVYKVLDLAGAERFDELTDYLVAALRPLAKAGVDFAIFASNTPHVVFTNVQRRSPSRCSVSSTRRATTRALSASNASASSARARR